MLKQIVSLILFLSLALSTACAPKELQPPAPKSTDDQVSKAEDFSSEEFFPYVSLKESANQDSYEEHRITLNFQVVNSNGAIVMGLAPEQFELKENQIPVPNFNMTISNPGDGQKVDIVIALDITSNAKNLVSTLKTQAEVLVKTLQSRNIKPLLCLVTFKDHTEKKCDKFVEDNPVTAVNENLQFFLDDLNKAKVASGGDSEQNQLRALIDASKAPFRANAQRIILLLTQSGFHYAPKKEGDAKADAPTYLEALKAVVGSQARIFALAPSKPGYEQKFGAENPLVDPIKGQYFNYEDFNKNKIKFQDIFDSIREKLTHQYQILYTIERNPGLNSSLPLTSRRFQLSVKNQSGYQVQMASMLSNQPLGHPQYKKIWRLAREAKMQSVNNAVFINGDKLESGYYFEKYNLRFDLAPPDGAKIFITYDPANFRDAVLTKPIVMPADIDLQSVQVKFNDKDMKVEELRLSTDVQGNFVLNPSIFVFTYHDPFLIFKNQGLRIKVFGEVIPGKNASKAREQ
jgi:hypothetical protein